MINEKDIYRLYEKESSEKGMASSCTMPDNGVRDLEIKILCKYISIAPNKRILEVGCGNGYVVSTISRMFPEVSFYAIDVNESMIGLCKQRSSLSNVCFETASVKFIPENLKEFDIVYTERCLMNLVSWEDQKRALDEICRVMKIGGTLLLIETFKSGWKMLNESRNVVGVEEIPIPWQSQPFDDDEFDRYLSDKFIKSDLLEGNDENFLSTYYYGARILYPALIEGRLELKYNNPFIEMFKHFPPILNYSPIQLRVLKKI
jgi:ubiquinone/menaquinone biosynthesis C-methylase UbiE